MARISLPEFNLFTVSALAFSPDGKTLAMGTEGEGQLAGPRVLRVAIPGGREVGQSPVPSKVTALAFSPDGKRLAAGSQDGIVRVWVLGLDSPREFRGHADAVEGLAFHPTRSALASASRDQSVRVWDGGTGEELNVLRGHRSYALRVAFSPDGSHLASSGLDSTVRVWDPLRDPALYRLGSVLGLDGRLAFSPDGRLLAACTYFGEEGGALLVPPDEKKADRLAPLKAWDLPDRKAVASLEGHGVLAFRPGGKILASARVLADQRRASADYRDLAAGKRTLGFDVETHKGDDPRDGRIRTAVQLSPDGRLLAVAGGDRTVTVHDLPGKRRVAVCRGLAEPADQMAFSPDGEVLATISYPSGAGPADDVRLWDTSSGEELFRLPGLKGNAVRLTFSPDGKMLAVVQNSQLQGQGMIRGEARVWDVAGRRELLVVGQRMPASGVAFSPDGRRLALGGVGGIVRLFELEGGEEILTLPTGSGVVWSLGFGPDGRRLAAACQRRDESVRGAEARLVDVLVFDGTPP